MTEKLYTSIFSFDTIVSSNKGNDLQGRERSKVDFMKRTERTKDVNQSVKSCFGTFRYNERLELKMAKKSPWIDKDAQRKYTIKNLRYYGDRLCHMLLGMTLVDAMPWRDYLRLRTRVSRLVDEYIAELKEITE